MNRSVKQCPEVILKHIFPIPPVHRQTSVSRVGFNSEPFCFLLIWRWNLRREEIGTRHTASRPSQFPYEPQSANRFPSMFHCKRHNTTKKYSNRPSASFFLFILCRIRSNNIHCRAIFKWLIWKLPYNGYYYIFGTRSAEKGRKRWVRNHTNLPVLTALCDWLQWQYRSRFSNAFAPNCEFCVSPES